jgi:hypothetical protein
MDLKELGRYFGEKQEQFRVFVVVAVESNEQVVQWSVEEGS